MKAHVVGVPVLFKCECGEKFIIGTWDKGKTDTFLTIKMLAFPGEMQYCPFCGGRGGITQGGSAGVAHETL